MDSAMVKRPNKVLMTDKSILWRMVKAQRRPMNSVVLVHIQRLAMVGLNIRILR